MVVGYIDEEDEEDEEDARGRERSAEQTRWASRLGLSVTGKYRSSDGTGVKIGGARGESGLHAGDSVKPSKEVTMRAAIIAKAWVGGSG